MYITSLSDLLLSKLFRLVAALSLPCIASTPSCLMWQYSYDRLNRPTLIVSEWNAYNTMRDANVVLEKSGVLTQVKDLLTKLLENRPENAVEFIAE